MRYRGVLDAILRIARHEGLSAFFKGIKLKLLQTVLAAALLMGCKQAVFDALVLLLRGRSNNRVALVRK